MKPIYTLCGQDAELMNVEVDGTYSTLNTYVGAGKVNMKYINYFPTSHSFYANAFSLTSAITFPCTLRYHMAMLIVQRYIDGCRLVLSVHVAKMNM
jgi:hypothetical protein